MTRFRLCLLIAAWLACCGFFITLNLSAEAQSTGEESRFSAGSVVITPTLELALPPSMDLEATLSSLDLPAQPTEFDGDPNLTIPDGRMLAQPEAVYLAVPTSNDWLTWLLTAQNAYGSWGDAYSTEARDTAEVVQTYRWMGLAGTSMQAAGNWAEQVS